MELNNNTVFITGGASGIGLALAEEFLNYENTVIICGRNPDKLELAKEKYPGLYTIRCDVSNMSEVHQTLEQIKSEFDGLNILVNNAGIQYRFDFYEDENTIEKIDEEIDINFRAVVHLTKLFLPILNKEKCTRLLCHESRTACLFQIPSLSVGKFICQGIRNHHASCRH
jgi:uncharacterized oxidoreductase